MKSSNQNMNSSLPTLTMALFDSLIMLLTQTINMIIPQTLSLQTILNCQSSTAHLTLTQLLKCFLMTYSVNSYRSRLYHLSLDYYNSLLIDLLVSSFAHITFIVHFPHFCQSKVIHILYIHTYTYNENLIKPLS